MVCLPAVPPGTCLGSPALLCNVSTSRPSPIIPAAWCCQVLDTIHTLSHPEVWAPTKLVRAKCVWAWAAACIACQHAMVHQHTETPLNRFRPNGLTMCMWTWWVLILLRRVLITCSRWWTGPPGVQRWFLFPPQPPWMWQTRFFPPGLFPALLNTILRLTAGVNAFTGH